MTGFILGVAVVLFFIFAACDWNFCALVCFCVALVVGVNACTDTEWYKEDQKRDAEARRQAATPHVIREFDGCKVYAFTTDREHYFTRCGSTVSTETNFSKSCGKNCTKQDSDTIVTGGNK